MREIILLTVSGQDRPGVTSALMKVLSDHNLNVLDGGQSVILDHLSLGVLVEIPDGATSGPVLKDALFEMHQLGLQISFEPIDEEAYERWVTDHGKPRYAITLLGRKLSGHNLSMVADVISAHGMNIERIDRLSGRFSLRNPNPHGRACIEISIRGETDNVTELREQLLEITRDEEIDIAFQADDLYRRNRRLIVFDMDSTLIQCEVIDELAKKAGVGDKVGAITEAAMRGEIDFNESFRQRLSQLEGLSESVLQDIAENLPITEGADRLIGTLKQLGYRVGILSGGFTYFANHLKERWGLDCVSANELEIVDGKLTGKHIGEIVNGERKAFLLSKMAEDLKIDMKQTIAVGDGANDLPMLSIAALGVAFHAKPLVRENARHSISTLGLDGILYLLGISDREVNQ